MLRTPDVYEFSVSGQQYRSEKMGVDEATHVFFKMAPIAGRMIQIAQSDDKAQSIFEFAIAVASLPNEQINFIIDSCTETVERRQGGENNPIWSPLKYRDQKGLMFHDVQFDDRLEIVSHVIYQNFWPILKKNLERLGIDLPNMLSNFSRLRTAQTST